MTSPHVGELSLLSLQEHLQSAASSVMRGGESIKVLDLVVGRELHKNPSRKLYNTHFHFVMRLSARLDNQSSSLFDPRGTSGMKLRVHIEQVENDLHYLNKVPHLACACYLGS